MIESLKEYIESDQYAGYAYAYPHKTAYRTFDKARPLQEIWAKEDKERLFLYIHIPFCEMRCGFCNLFTSIRPEQSRVETTLNSLLRQSRQVAEAIEPKKVTQVAIGGGTPSFLSESQLERLFGEIARHWPVDWQSVPLSFESSPGTLTPRKLRLLKELGVKRLSLGVQSFAAEDLEDLKRPQSLAEVERVCELIKGTKFDIFNLDLIYGNLKQTEQSWERSLRAALGYQPQELYLYPLYVGKLTRLDLLGRRPGERRRDLYRQAHQRLSEAGYAAQSMRLYSQHPDPNQPDYCCQDDGMVGLGPGARSYTKALHYSSEYAVGQPGVRAIVRAFDSLDFQHAHYGVELDEEEQRRRFLLKSLLKVSGIDFAHYERRFSSHPMTDLPQLAELLDLRLAELSPSHLRLNLNGLAFTDSIGPWLYSPKIQSQMREFLLQ